MRRLSPTGEEKVHGMGSDMAEEKATGDGGSGSLGVLLSRLGTGPE